MTIRHHPYPPLLRKDELCSELQRTRLVGAESLATHVICALTLQQALCSASAVENVLNPIQRASRRYPAFGHPNTSRISIVRTFTGCTRDPVRLTRASGDTGGPSAGAGAEALIAGPKITLSLRYFVLKARLGIHPTSTA
jgi:hypothetical protein